MVTNVGPARSPIPVGDLAARRIVALSRVAVALTVAALASVDTILLPEWAAWAAGLLWLGWASWLWFAEEGPANRARTAAGIVGDMVVVVTLMALLPEHAPVITLFAAPFVAAVAYQSGSTVGMGFALAVIGSRWVVAAALGFGPADRISHTAVDIAATLVLVASVVLIDRALTIQRRDARNLAITARKSEMILATSSEAVLLTDTGGVILQANPAAERVLTSPTGQALVGHACASRLALHRGDGHLLDCRTSCELARLCGEAGEDADLGVEVWRHANGVRQPFLANATRVEGADGSVEFVHSLRDVTRVKQAEEAKTMFLATASHELKTPLTVIRGFTQVLMTRVSDPHSVVALEAIDSRSRQLVQIVDRLLLSSRIESGRVEVSTGDHDVEHLLRARVAEGSRTIGRIVELDVTPGLRGHVAEDALTTVLDHLIDNAAKYSPGGQPISVRGYEAGSWIVIAVIDQGIGMTAEQVERCFERFWQAEATDVRRFGGTGVGLYVVRALVEAMNGAVTASSVPGAGSQFTLRLPRFAPVEGSIRRPAQAGTGREVGAADERDPDAALTAARTGVDEFLQQLGLGSEVQR